jgi:hypothetical protein
MHELLVNKMKVENKIKVIALIISVFIFAFVYFVVSFIVSNITFNEKINYPDWISAGCNVAMAIAALGGFWIAKDWKKTSVREKVISHALDLKVTHLNKLRRSTFILRFCVEDFRAIYDYQDGDKASKNFVLYRLDEFYNKLLEKTNHFQNHLNEAMVEKSKIEALGFRFKNINDKSLDLILHELGFLETKVLSFQSEVAGLISVINQNQLDTITIPNRSTVETSLQLSQDINKVEESLVLYVYSNISVLNLLEYAG